MKKTAYIISVSSLICALLAFVEHGMDVNYVVKSLSKMTLFFLAIWLYTRLFGDFRFKDVLTLDKMNRRDWLRLLFLGALSASIVLAAYLLLSPYFSVSQIKQDITGRLGISATGFIFVGIYITFINSLLEEYFFRGFIFFQLPRKIGYFFSPLLFATYHIPMIALWFSPSLIITCFVGLWGIAIVFHKVNERNQTIWFSWIIHVCADIMIIAIGITLFYF
ncbi:MULTISPECIES: CPBP family intramembrane glutamic endopeptidase [Virgibacillus]|uniref:CAAX protease self-immunity n=1 Tax=Virgibacillus chiguensis TaxID=411959 RepID=A0A1M5L9M5_9BACI|nr:MULTISPECIES: CPBP family intramembrane glutamic endopeptidase [Virgibacillus]SHG61625.1 CAAX protease self-immunity [Virgibacillus chiguensis]